MKDKECVAHLLHSDILAVLDDRVHQVKRNSKTRSGAGTGDVHTGRKGDFPYLPGEFRHDGRVEERVFCENASWRVIVCLPSTRLKASIASCQFNKVVK